MGSAGTPSSAHALSGDDLKRDRQVSVHPRIAVWALLVVAIATFWPTLAALSGTWLHVADYQYGPLVAAISLWMFARESSRIDASRVRPQPLALPLLAAALFVWMVAYRANSDMLQQLLFPTVLLISIYAALGPSAVRRVAFPVAYFSCALPFWDHFVPLLQWMTTQAAENLLALLNVPTVVDGHQVTIPAGRFSIIEGCSGKRYFIVGLSFAALLGPVLDIKRGKLLALLAAAAVIAILINWIRVVVVIYAGHVSNMQHYLVAVEHKSLGYALFVPTLLAILWVGKRLAPPQAVTQEPAPNATLPWSTAARYASGPALLFVVALLALGVRARASDAASVVLGSYPVYVDEWQGPLPASRSWQPEFTGASDERRASYADSQGRIEIYVNAYGVQNPGHELVFHGNAVAPAHSWTSVGRRPSNAGLRMSVATHPSYGRWVFAYSYVVGGRTTPSPLRAQFLYGVSALTDPDASGVAAMAASCKADCSAEAARIEAFWTRNSQALANMIPASSLGGSGTTQ